MKRALLVALLVAASVLVVAGPVEASAPVEGCAMVKHHPPVSTASHTRFRVAKTVNAATDTCPASADYTLLEAHCITLAVHYARAGAAAPPDPTVWEVYWYHGTTEDDHGASGSASWSNYLKRVTYTSTPSGSVEFCATATGESGGSALSGVFRVVLRTCTPSTARTTCNGGASSWDINSDTNAVSGSQGTPAAGYAAQGFPAAYTAAENPHIMDPLWVISREEYELGEPVHLFIHSELDNGSARTGGASNITVFLQAPDGSYPVNNQTVTEIVYPADHPLKGNYRFTYTPSVTGLYNVTVQTVTNKNETRTSKPWSFLVVTPEVGGVSAHGAYSWDTHDLSVVARVADANGTSRAGLSVTFKLFQPDGAASTTGTMKAGNLPGTYTAKTYLGTDPMLGPWTAYVEVPAQGNGGGNLSAVLTVIVAENVTLLLEDARAFAVDMWASFNASFQYTWELQNATTGYTNSLTNASRAEVLAAIGNLSANATNGPAPWAVFTAQNISTGPAPGYYANKSVRFQANASNNASWGPLLYLWDFGDNATGSGPVAYHSFAAGNYTVSLTVFTATGNTTTVNRSLTVNESTPWANVTGPRHPTQWHKVTYDARGSVDHYDEIVRVEWAVNPGEYHDIPFIGSLNLNAGSGVGSTFSYTWALVGNQTLRVNVTNSQGVTNTTWYNVTVHDAVRFETTVNEHPEYGQLGEDMAAGAQHGVDRIQRFVKFWAWVMSGFKG